MEKRSSLSDVTEAVIARAKKIKVIVFDIDGELAVTVATSVMALKLVAPTAEAQDKDAVFVITCSGSTLPLSV